MFTDYFDVGMVVEDRQAGRIASRALDQGYEPRFQNARGPFLEVQFAPPRGGERTDLGQCSSSSNGNSAEGTREGADGNPFLPPPLLYGWMEQVPGDSVIHVVRTTAESESDASDGGGRSAGRDRKDRRVEREPVAGAAAVSEAEVCGQVSYILHLWSTPHTERAMLPTSHTTEDKETALLSAEERRRRQEDERLFNAHGEDVVLTDPAARELELRDDSDTVRAAVDTIVTVGRLLKDNPSAQVSCLVDERDGSTVLKFQ